LSAAAAADYFCSKDNYNEKILALFLAGTVLPAWGGIYIYGTRIIYPAQKRDYRAVNE
jgi:P pilus assembly chaperone PapD